MARGTKSDQSSDADQQMAENLVGDTVELKEPEAVTVAEEVTSPTGYGARPGRDDPKDDLPPRSDGAHSHPSTFWPLVLGGAVAAAVGCGGGLYLATAQPALFGLTRADGGDGLAALEGQLADLSQRVETVEAGRSAAAEAANKAAQEAIARTDGLNATVKDIAGRVQTLEAGVPVVNGDTAGIAAMAKEAQDKADAAAQVAAAAQADAAAYARQAEIRSAVGQITVAVQNGGAFDDAIARLKDAGVAVDEQLATQAQGVPTLQALQDTFPQAARDALGASLAADADTGGIWGRMDAFLRSQVGARSLTPRAGDDPDAILSRAEASLRASDLRQALAEIATLPAAGQDRMAEWSGLAQKRLDATNAVAALNAAGN